MKHAAFQFALAAGLFAHLAGAADFHPPAEDRYAQVAAGGTILPGGRFLKPFGVTIETGPGPAAIALSPKGAVATADTGFERFGVTVIEPRTKSPWQVKHFWARTPGSAAAELADPDWLSVAAGIAFDSEKSLWVSEGASGRLRQIDTSSGDSRRTVKAVEGSAGDIAIDTAKHLLYALDRTNAKLAVLDARTGRKISSVSLDADPHAIALAPGAAVAYVASGNSVCAIDVSNPPAPSMSYCVPLAAPGYLSVTAERVYVSSAAADSIVVISVAGRKALGQIPLRIPNLAQYRGIAPSGLAYDPVTNWLLVAETGINAVGVVDTATNQVIGHLPAGWMPTQILMSGDRVFVANARGRGTGPNPRRVILELGEVPVLHRGSVTTFTMPDAAEIQRQTPVVLALNGFLPYAANPPAFPDQIRNVVLIVKGNRTFDEVLGDVPKSANGSAEALPLLARYGLHGVGRGGRTQFSVKDAPITPNQHEIARRWTFSDNFYTDANTEAEGSRWTSADWIPTHLERAGLTFRSVDEGTGPQAADRVTAALNAAGEPLPRLLVIHLPSDRTGIPKPLEGYPFESSFAADNDLAAGRVLAALSRLPEWRNMAVFITENDTQGGLDHIDAHRTLLLAAGPYMKRNYVSHTNASMPGLWRTIFGLLHAPPHGLLDATGPDLHDLFTAEPDLTPFDAMQPDPRIFNPADTKKTP